MELSGEPGDDQPATTRSKPMKGSFERVSPKARPRDRKNGRVGLRSQGVRDIPGVLECRVVSLLARRLGNHIIWNL